ncbi:MAG: diacylglycerol kinase family protein [Actinomycetia bacterium]|nr:diacylglycerol kinase family protein [Actinomycetes bacterium]
MAKKTNKPGQSSLPAAFSFAIQGIAYTVRSQRNMRIHLVVAVLAVIAGFVLCLSAVEWSVIVICIALVLATEMLNTAIEAVVDLASPELHPKAKIAKDVGAGIVLIFALLSVISGLIVFVNALIRLVGFG